MRLSFGTRAYLTARFCLTIHPFSIYSADTPTRAAGTTMSTALSLWPSSKAQRRCTSQLRLSAALTPEAAQSSSIMRMILKLNVSLLFIISLIFPVCQAMSLPMA